jgi:hypothetical protein
MPRQSLIEFRQGPASEWLSINPILSSGEPGFDISNNVLKIGNGTARWNFLPPIGSGAAIISQQYKNYTSIDNDYTILDSDDIIFIDTETKSVSVEMPSANGLGGKELVIKKMTGNHQVTINASGSQTIDGNNVVFINYNYESIKLVSNNHNWFIV